MFFYDPLVEKNTIENQKLKNVTLFALIRSINFVQDSF